MSINTRRSNRVGEGKQLLAPKRPSTAYHLFMKEHYDNVAKNNRGLQPLHRTEIMVIIGKMWKALSAEEKKCYEDAVADRWKKYREIFAEYEKNRGLLYHP
uniref:HMG box domain-containing protein n=1 Tax=Panagrolaimus sp. JU765 TaxID=591449 RepID=A0AC34RC36_9BILA